ncbi:hypothetical protein Tco_0533576 [Tanacetum coccineum]
MTAKIPTTVPVKTVKECGLDSNDVMVEAADFSWSVVDLEGGKLTDLDDGGGGNSKRGEDEFSFYLDWDVLKDDIISYVQEFENLTYIPRVLVNGSPTMEFHMERGLRQGDPLSPFLFIIAVEALNVSILHARNNNLFHGVKVGVDNVHVSHLQFANDVLIYGLWSI